MVTYDEYVKSILVQIMDSYKYISNLKDKPGDLDKIKVEWLKVSGLLNALVKKLETSKNTSENYAILLKKSKFYLENYDFEREITIMSGLYSEDPDRLRNIRYKIIESLDDKKFVEKIESIIPEL